MLAEERMGIAPARLTEVARSSIEASFAPEEVKRAALAR